MLCRPRIRSIDRRVGPVGSTRIRKKEGVGCRVRHQYPRSSVVCLRLVELDSGVGHPAHHDTMEAQAPADLDMHLIVGNHVTHKTALIRNRFAKRPRCHVHFKPTSASWLNLVEGGGLHRSPTNNCAGECTRAAVTWKLRSSDTGTSPPKTPNPWSG